MNKLDILYETTDLIALNKPSGTLSIPDREQSEPSIKDFLLRQFDQIFTVHRLDRDTSGVIIFAKNEDSHRFLSKQFEERTTEKYYNGFVVGKVYDETGLIDQPIGENPAKKGQMTITRQGKPSQTAFTTLQSFARYSWMRFRIFSGRTHQIRVHMKHYGHPIVCDPYYGDGQPILVSSLKKNFKLAKDVLEERPILGRLALHASALGFTDLSGEAVTIEAPLPKDLRATLQQLDKLGR